jgi:ELWxxDGT repeat protein
VFQADDGTGSEAWVTDGTTAGTSLFKDINLGSGAGIPTGFVQDTKAPAALSVPDPTWTDTGVHDNVTSVTTPVFSGTADLAAR